MHNPKPPAATPKAAIETFFEAFPRGSYFEFNDTTYVDTLGPHDYPASLALDSVVTWHINVGNEPPKQTLIKSITCTPAQMDRFVEICLDMVSRW